MQCTVCIQLAEEGRSIVYTCRWAGRYVCVCLCVFVCVQYVCVIIARKPQKSQHTNVQCTMHYSVCIQDGYVWWGKVNALCYVYSHHNYWVMHLMNRQFEQWETDKEHLARLCMVKVQSISWYSWFKSHPATVISCSSSSPTHTQHGTHDTAYSRSWTEHWVLWLAHQWRGSGERCPPAWTLPKPKTASSQLLPMNSTIITV